MAPLVITAQDIRRVEFRERLRGYHQGDVDEFLERVATAIEELEEQLRQASNGRPGAAVAVPTAAAVAPPVPAAPPAGATPRTGAPGSEQSLRRTLELAQRAADLAVQEAREQGSAIVAAAEADAAALVATADEQARVLTEEARRDVAAEVARLEAARDTLLAELEVLAGLVEQERTRGRAWLADVAAAIDQPIAPAPGDEPHDEPGPPEPPDQGPPPSTPVPRN